MDAALGAEEMVDQLGQQKLTLEDRMKELEETIADLEALQEVNDQLQEDSRELEMDLREEVDLALAATREVGHCAWVVTNSNQKYTIKIYLMNSWYNLHDENPK